MQRVYERTGLRIEWEPTEWFVWGKRSQLRRLDGHRVTTVKDPEAFENELEDGENDGHDTLQVGNQGPCDNDGQSYEAIQQQSSNSEGVQSQTHEQQFRAAYYREKRDRVSSRHLKKGSPVLFDPSDYESPRNRPKANSLPSSSRRRRRMLQSARHRNEANRSSLRRVSSNSGVVGSNGTRDATSSTAQLISPFQRLSPFRPLPPHIHSLQKPATSQGQNPRDKGETTATATAGVVEDSADDNGDDEVEEQQQTQQTQQQQPQHKSNEQRDSEEPFPGAAS